MKDKAKKLKNWHEVARGGAVMEAGSTTELNTGTWRTYVPVRTMAKCIHCMRCWIMCPDSSVLTKDGKIVGTDLLHCKGCGICAKECPVDAIEMKLEADIKEGAPKG
jgi:pyruvate ferredoxin oxidoreductase delta subunit